jgi:alkaline phosphatase D
MKNQCKRLIFMRKLFLKTSLFAVMVSFSLTAGAIGDSVFFTTGFKAGDVSSHSVILLTRLCSMSSPVPVWHSRSDGPFRSPLNFDEDMLVNQMDGYVEGSEGEVRFTLVSGNLRLVSGWKKARKEDDYMVRTVFNALESYTHYQVLIEGRKKRGKPVSMITGSFRTAPEDDMVVPVELTSSSCQYFWDFDDPVRGFMIYDSMLKLHPDFFVQTGDYVYYDKPGPLADNIEKARHKWSAMNAWPSIVDFSSSVPFYIEKDDHDMLRDDAYPTIEPYGTLTFRDALEIWYRHVPVGDKPYRTFRWGKDLQIWLVEGREYRSANTMPDGPGKTIWGEAQKDWLEQTMKSSNASFKILFSQTPVVGPDRDKGKNDNYANKAFETEGEWARKFLSSVDNLYVINGDRHWQYVSVDDETGLTEFSQGPASDSHAQGWDPSDKRPEHRFLRVKGGFIGVKVDREKDKPQIVFTLYDVDGVVVHEEKFFSK